MGRQIPIVTTPADERELLQFANSLAPIRVFRVFAPTVEELWVSDWETREIPDRHYSIWPQTFPWEPTYGQTGGPGCPPERAGLYYVANASAAPVVEFSRGSDERKDGRLYWARNFSAPNGLVYDATVFAQFVDQLWRWVRKHGRRMAKEAYAPYYLPGAYAQPPPGEG